MGGKSGGDQEVTTRTEIPRFLRPFVENQARVGSDALTRLEGQLQGAGSDQLVAGFDPLQQQAQDLAIQRAQGAGGFIPTAQQTFLDTAQGVNPQSFIDPSAFGALQSTAQGDFLFGGQGFDQAVQAALRAAQPGILSTFGGAGRGTGGLAQAAIAQQATDAFARQFGQERANQLNASSTLAGFGEAERARQLQAAGVLPQLALADASILEGIGGQRQALAQRQLTAPISAQEALLQAAGGGIPLASTLGSTSSQPLTSNPIAGALGGGLTGLALASGLSGIGGTAAAGGAAATAGPLAFLGGPWGLAAGAGVGLLGGLLS